MPTHGSSDDFDPHRSHQLKLFGSLHEVIGEGRVADVLLWKNRGISAAFLVGATVIWFLFEVYEYHLLTLLCHIAIIAMLVTYIWSNIGARMGLIRNPPFDDFKLSKEVFTEAALAFHMKLDQFLSITYLVACGEDLTRFVLTIVFLWILSVIGTCFNFLTLLYLGFLCVHTLPALYQRYEHDVDYYASIATQELHNLYIKFDSNVLNKIPRGPVKEKKHK